MSTRLGSLAHRAARKVKRRVTGGAVVADAPAVPRAAPPPAPPADGDGVEVVTSLARLDEKLVEVDEAFKVSDDAMRAVFKSFRLELPPASSADPWSDEYRAEQFDLYRRLSQRPDYRPENEESGYRVDSRRPFPYYTGSADTVSNQLLAIGFLLKTMNLPPGSSVLEYGAGWGNTTIALAWTGYRVHAIDIDPNFVEMIGERAARLGLDGVRAEVGEFLGVSELRDRYDAVVFYESFHHCSDHVRLLRELHDVLLPGGKVVLASEPVTEAFHAPWGLRLDGESLWAIRANGWLELGFTESYFLETCLRTGWSVRKHTTDVTPLGTVLVLSSTRGGPVKPGDLMMPAADDLTWAAPDLDATGQRYTLGRSRLVVETGRDADEVAVELVNPSPHRLCTVIEHGSSIRRIDLDPGVSLEVLLPYDLSAGELFVGAPTWTPAKVIAGSTDEREIGVGVRSVELR